MQHIIPGNHLLPVADKNRIQSLDILRGIALLGILLMNIPEFSLPRRYSEDFRNDPESINFWARVIMLLFFEGKMRALFSLLFGAGIVLFFTNKTAVTKVVVKLFYKRMFWLIVFGLIDAYLLLWDGDILYLYAVTGMIAVLFLRVKSKWLVWAVPLVAIVEFVLQTNFYQDIREKRMAYVATTKAISGDTGATKEQQEVMEEWREIEKTFLPNTQDIAEHTRTMKSNYAAIAKKKRALSWQYQTTYLIYSIWDPLALMLLGMALLRWGFLTNQWTTRQYRWTLILGYGLGLPLVAWEIYYGYRYIPNLEAWLAQMESIRIPWHNLLYPIQRIAIMMGHIALVMLIIRRGILKRLLGCLAAVGQMALTNYIMQTILCSFIFLGFGLNYFDAFQYYQIFYFIVVIWLFQLLTSFIWLQYFLFGPLEWLWRVLTYWKIQGFRRDRSNENQHAVI